MAFGIAIEVVAEEDTAVEGVAVADIAVEQAAEEDTAVEGVDKEDIEVEEAAGVVVLVHYSLSAHRIYYKKLNHHGPVAHIYYRMAF